MVFKYCANPARCQSSVLSATATMCSLMQSLLLQAIETAGHAAKEGLGLPSAGAMGDTKVRTLAVCANVFYTWCQKGVLLSALRNAVCCNVSNTTIRSLLQLCSCMWCRQLQTLLGNLQPHTHA